MLYPLRFRPVYRPYLWGGRALERFRADVPATGPLAESWEVSCLPDGLSVVSGGVLDRLTLPDVIARFGPEVLGRDVAARTGGRFPLLVKLLDAALPLSVQVHPGDADAARLEVGQSGKAEMWYVLEARPGATVVAGLKTGTTRERLARALEEGDPEPLLHRIEVRPGDVVDIPPGSVHAIGAGLFLYELQQSSDVTYRLHDWGRRDAAGRQRPLQVPKALESIDFRHRAAGVRRALPYRRPDAGRTTGEVLRRTLVSNAHFRVDEFTLGIGSTARFEAAGDRFRVLTGVAGEGWLRYVDEKGRPVTMPLRTAETVLVPAALGGYVLEGPLTVLEAVPSV